MFTIRFCVWGFNSQSFTVVPVFTWTSLFGDLFLILFQNEKQIIEMSVDIHRLINSIFFFFFLRLTMMCHKSWDRMEIWRKFVSRL